MNCKECGAWCREGVPRDHDQACSQYGPGTVPKGADGKYGPGIEALCAEASKMYDGMAKEQQSPTEEKTEGDAMLEFFKGK